MPDQILYGKLMHNALRQLVAEVLQEVAQNGLPGDHHFIVSFDTSADGVVIPEYLQKKFPKEMTFVLQHRFKDLEVYPTGFSVTLNFSKVPERLEIPFEALTAFVDPSVEFGLRFDAQEDELEGEIPLDPPVKDESNEEETPKEGEVVSLDQFRKS